MTKTTLPSAEPVVADLRPTAAGSDRVCASCGGNVKLVDGEKPARAWSHVRTPRSPHRIEVVMSRAQWDKWKQ